MFVRFRTTRQRLQVSLVENCRAGAKVKQEHVASLGAVALPASIADRVAFWQALHQRFAQLSNRIDEPTRCKIMGAVHERIPMVTIDENRALQRELLEAEERFWGDIRDWQRSLAEDHKGLIAAAERAAAASEVQSKQAAAKFDSIKDRLARLAAGEVVTGGFKPLSYEDMRRILYEAGWTDRDIQHARDLAEIPDLEGYTEEVLKRHRRAEFAAARSFLKRQQSTRR